MASPANSQLFASFRNKASQAKVAVKKEVEQTAEQKLAYYGPLLTKLTDLILKDWAKKAERAAERGFTKTNLFYYHNGDKFNGKVVGQTGSAVAFLMKGLRGQPDFWAKEGLVPVLDRVRKAVEPATIKFWFTGHKNGTVVELDWSGESTEAPKSEPDQQSEAGNSAEPEVTEPVDEHTQ